MKKMINASHIEGVLYQHDLELKTSGENSKNPGTEFIAGNIEIATDDAGINIVPVHFTYVTATTAKGKVNDTFNTLKNIITGVYKSVMKDGADVATKFRIDSAIGLNEFYSDRTGTEELVSVKRNEGGFVHVVAALGDDEKARNTFDCDIIITSVIRKEADEEKNIPEKGIVKGAIFNFRGDLLPVEFSVLNDRAIAYFEDLGASKTNPVFTRIKGRQISESITRRVEEESAFGEPSIREYTSTRKDFVITWAAKEEYEWDSEGSILATELKEAMANREIALAEMKKRSDEYKASRGNAIPSAAAAPTPGAFNF